MIEKIGQLKRCWRRAARETRSGLQVTWHDGGLCDGPNEKCRHAVVVGRPRRAALDDDCSSGRVKQVETATSLYTADEFEAEAVYENALEFARQRGREASRRPVQQLDERGDAPHEDSG